MNSDWSRVRIDEIGEVKSGKRLPLGHTLTDSPTDFPYIRLVDIADGRVSLNNLQFLRPETRIQIKRYVVKSNDVCLAIVGHTIGTVFYIDEKFDDVNLTENAARITSIKDLLNPKYLYYYFTSPVGQAEIQARKVGSAQGKLPLYNIKSLEILIPSRETQDRVVALLDALDNRITLLRESNTTLEAIAQALFKSWFVDFDPVRAKVEGLEPEGMDAATAALFPDSFEETELGVVPREWGYVSLKEVTAIFDSRRVPLSGQERAKRQGSYPYYGAAALMDWVDDYLFDGVYFLTGEDGSVADTSGYPITQYVWGRIWVNNHAHVLQGKNGVSTEHLMLSLKQTNIGPYITGAVQAKLSQSNMWRIPFLKPTSVIAEAFGDMVAPIFTSFRHNVEQAKTLTQLRDTLLPRLISGQLRLPEAEMMVEDVCA